MFRIGKLYVGIWRSKQNPIFKKRKCYAYIEIRIYSPMRWLDTYFYASIALSLYENSVMLDCQCRDFTNSAICGDFRRRQHNNSPFFCFDKASWHWHVLFIVIPLLHCSLLATERTVFVSIYPSIKYSAEYTGSSEY